jgi:hypothetical protein
MNNVDALRISQQRDDIYDAVCDRFKELMKEDNIDGALALADEFFEWMDPDQLEQEETLYYNEEELLELYAQRISE